MLRVMSLMRSVWLLMIICPWLKIAGSDTVQGFACGAVGLSVGLLVVGCLFVYLFVCLFVC